MGKGKGNNHVPDNVTDGLDNLGDALEDGKDTIKDEVGKWVPDLDVQNKLGDLYNDIQDLWEKGYPNIDVKGITSTPGPTKFLTTQISTLLSREPTRLWSRDRKEMT